MLYYESSEPQVSPYVGLAGDAAAQRSLGLFHPPLRSCSTAGEVDILLQAAESSIFDSLS